MGLPLCIDQLIDAYWNVLDLCDQTIQLHLTLHNRSWLYMVRQEVCYNGQEVSNTQ